MIGEIGDFEIAISLIVLSLLVWFASYKYSMRIIEKEGVFIIIRTQKEMLPAGSFCCLLEKVIFLLEEKSG